MLPPGPAAFQFSFSSVQFHFHLPLHRLVETDRQDVVEHNNGAATGSMTEVEGETQDVTGKLWVKGGWEVCLPGGRKGGC